MPQASDQVCGSTKNTGAGVKASASPQPRSRISQLASTAVSTVTAIPRLPPPAQPRIVQLHGNSGRAAAGSPRPGRRAPVAPRQRDRAAGSQTACRRSGSRPVGGTPRPAPAPAPVLLPRCSSSPQPPFAAGSLRLAPGPPWVPSQSPETSPPYLHLEYSSLKI